MYPAKLSALTLILIPSVLISFGNLRAAEMFAHVACCDHDGDSRDQREDQHVVAFFGADGYGLGLFLSRDTLFEVGYGGFLPGDDPEALAPGIWSDAFFAQVKRFRGNSFYTKIGLDHHRAGTPLDRWTSPRWTETSLLLGIGNQWQWSWVTVGVDWVRAEIPFLRTARKVSQEKKKTTFDGRLDRHHPNLRWSFLRLTAGVTF